MLKSKDIYTDKIATKAFLLDKYDIDKNKKEEVPMDDKEHIGIHFENIDKLEEYKQLKSDYNACMKLNQMWNAYINNMITNR